MSVLGNGSTSIKKQDLSTQEQVVTGFVKLMFAHKATGGETSINLNALTTPPEMSANGFVQPSAAQLAAAQLMFFKKNLTLISSASGVLDPYLSYSISTNSTITLANAALPGEIFIGTIDPVATSGTRVVDATAIVATGTVAAGTTDFNVGTPFSINKYPNSQMGAVIVFVDGVQQFRNSGNSSTNLDGNYYEVDAGGGLGTIIRLNTTDTSLRNILAVSNGLLAERPDGSMMATIEAVQGQVNNVATYVAALSGNTTTTVLGAAPSSVDLKAFGDRVFTLEQNRARVDVSNTWTAAQALLVGTTIGGIRVDAKEYVAGTAYTNGTPTITCAQAGFVVARGVMVPYQTLDGAWRMRFNLAATFTTASVNGVLIAISGVTFKNVSNYYQPMSLMYFGTTGVGRVYTNFNANTIQTDMATGAAVAGISGVSISGDVELDSKPTWAD